MNLLTQYKLLPHVHTLPIQVKFFAELHCILLVQLPPLYKFIGRHFCDDEDLVIILTYFMVINIQCSQRIFHVYVCALPYRYLCSYVCVCLRLYMRVTNEFETNTKNT